MSAAEASTGNVFNMSGLQRFPNKERDKEITFGCYNGTPEITLVDGYKKGVAPKKVKLNYAQLYLLERTLEKLINNPGPNLNAPLKFTKMERDADGKWSKPRVYCIVQFSTDDKSVIHIGVKWMDDESNPVSCMSPIRTTGVESDLIMDQASSSLNAANGLLKWIKHSWQESANFTRNNLYIPNKNNNKSSSGGGDLLSFDSKPSEDSVPF